jgi:hypothetical protein
MYKNGKMRPIKTIQRMGREGIDENDRGDDFFFFDHIGV